MKKGSVSLDFDGVINSYSSGYSQYVVSDPPVSGSFAFIRKIVNAGYEVYIFSTRNSDDAGKKLIFNWLKKHGLEEFYLSKLKFPSNKPIAKIYIDDRAWQFRGTFPSLGEIEQFIPWHGNKSSSQK